MTCCLRGVLAEAVWPRPWVCSWRALDHPLTESVGSGRCLELWGGCNITGVAIVCAHCLLELRRVCATIPMRAASCWRSGCVIEASARQAQHTVEEAKRYSTNCTYELCDTSAAALKLVRADRALLGSSARNPLSPRRNSCAGLL
jgi:hypothetical protein